jgi:hypothetical protein
MSRAAHAVESKAVVRIEVAVSPRPCLGCAVELVLEFFFGEHIVSRLDLDFFFSPPGRKIQHMQKHLKYLGVLNGISVLKMEYWTAYRAKREH